MSVSDQHNSKTSLSPSNEHLFKQTISLSLFEVAMSFFQYEWWPTLLYCRNQCFALSFLLACVQILDFLSFHHLFGPWAIIIGDLMKDLGRFLVVLAIFVFGFSMHIVALNQPFKTPDEIREKGMKKSRGYFSDGKCAPVQSIILTF